MTQSTERFNEYAGQWITALDRKKAAVAEVLEADLEARNADIWLTSVVDHLRDCLDQKLVVRATTIGDRIVMISRAKDEERSSMLIQTCEKE